MVSRWELLALLTLGALSTPRIGRIQQSKNDRQERGLGKSTQSIGNGRLVEAMLDSESSRRGARVDIQLVIDRAQMLPDCARADREPIPDVRISQTVRDKSEHFH